MTPPESPGATLQTPSPWDEMVNGRGKFRPGWSTLLATLSDIGRDGLAGRVAQLDRIAAEEGVAGLLPGAAPASRRLDPVPLLLGSVEFDALEAGLAQRARLLDAVLGDLYGPQTLLASGAIPPGLVFANPAFLRPCRAIEGSAPGRRLHVYAAELLRGPDGAWRVLADRTADAAGIAYALENRRALARVMPELFRDQPPRRISSFFEAWQDALHRLAPAELGAPGVALLTSGPADKLWFEHVVLARELSCTLVEGADLTARDGALFLKTLKGLRRIDVVLRRQDGRTLDPLELETWSRNGVPGLLDALRGGAVRMVNDPGTGCAEAPALLALLPSLARPLLGEDLLLPSVPCVWLGDPDGRTRVLSRLEEWRIRSALDGTVPPIMPSELSPEERALLAARIAESPDDFCAIAVTPPSVAPCFAPPGFSPQPVMLRLFLMFDGERWRAMPGGLARALPPTEPLSGRYPLHALSKDVWVAAKDEHDLVGPAYLSAPRLTLRRTSGDLPSRVADNFYWLGRYLERLDGTARLLRTALDRLERPNHTPRELAELQTLARCLVHAGLLASDDATGLGPAALGDALLGAAQGQGTLPRALSDISRLAELLRDRLTREVHTTVTRGLRDLAETLAPLQSGERAARSVPGLEILGDAAASVLTFTAAVAGLAAENMVRSGGRLFLDLGRRIERAHATAGAIACLLHQEHVKAQPSRLEPALNAVLELCDSVITYRSRYLSVLQPAPVLDLVLADEGNPRGLAFQFQAAREILTELAGSAGNPLSDAAGRLFDQVRTMALGVSRAPEQGAATFAATAQLHEIGEATLALSDQIRRRYFALLPPVRGLGVEEAARGLQGVA